MSFKLTVLGCGSAIPSLNNKPTSQLLNVGEQFFLIDCGEGTQVQLQKYNLSHHRISHILISHLHGDHYFGLIGLITSMHLLGRTKDLHVYAHNELKYIIDNQLNASKTELNYPLFFHPISDEKEGVIFENDKVRIEGLILNHTIKCSGFIFIEKKSSRKILKEAIEKYKIPFDQIKGIQNGADWFDSHGKVINNDQITIANSKSKSYVFCTDTRYDEKIAKKFKNADLLYYDCTFMHDLRDRAKKTGHATSYQAGLMAKKSSSKNLMIGHYSQRYKDHEDLLQEAKKIFPKTFLAKQGLCVDFNKLTN